jgi:hypothetical protein
MGWYLRKSFGFGPVRLNLSKSGLGYSVGVRGARIGVGPRGNYIRLGRGGVYYQKYFSSTGSARLNLQPPISPAVDLPALGTAISTAHASELRDSTSEGLLNEIQQKHQRARLAPAQAVLATMLVAGLSIANVSLWFIVPVVLVLAVGHGLLAWRDYAEKLVVLNYDLDSDARARYVELLKALQEFSSSSRIWRITSRQFGVDRKYHAGADTLLDKKATSLRLAPPPDLQTEIAVWALPVGDQVLYFFPDRILVYEGSQVGTAHYEALNVALGQSRFVEGDAVPPDAQIVAYTWRYVNKNGTPDRRFGNNRQLPVVLYGQLAITSSSGLNIVLESSDPRKAATFKTAMDKYASGNRK